MWKCLFLSHCKELREELCFLLVRYDSNKNSGHTSTLLRLNDGLLWQSFMPQLKMRIFLAKRTHNNQVMSGCHAANQAVINSANYASDWETSHKITSIKFGKDASRILWLRSKTFLTLTSNKKFH